MKILRIDLSHHYFCTCYTARFCHSRKKKQESQRSLKLISSDDEFSGEVDEESLRTKVMTVGRPREQRPLDLSD